jgi:hypothetical protein
MEMPASCSPCELDSLSFLRQLLRPANLTRLPPRRRLSYAAPLLDGLVIRPVPTFGYRREAPLLSDGLEAKPAVSEFRGDRSTGVPDLTHPSLETGAPLYFVGPHVAVCAPLGKPTLCRRGMDLPHIPDLAVPILECSVRHRISRA